MNAPLPTAEELEKLPMRAMVAYAARTARRVSSEFRGVIADDILDDAIRLVEIVSTTNVIGEVDQASIIRAGQRVVEAFAGVPEGMRSVQKFFLLFSFVEAGLAATNAIEAAVHPSNARYHMKRVAKQAELAVRPIKSLRGATANAAMQAARRDYDILLREYGKHEDAVIGDPVVCFREE